MTEAPRWYEEFMAALRYCLKQKGHGAKRELADHLGVGQNHISYILRTDDKRRIMSAVHQEKSADFFGYKFGEFLALGEHILSGEIFWGVGFNRLPKNSDARAKMIVEKALRDAGLHEVAFLSYNSLRVGNVNGLEDYLLGGLTDDELYEKVLSALEGLRVAIG